MSRRTELDMFEKLIPSIEKHGALTQLGTVPVEDQALPIWGLRIGPQDPSLPTFGLFGGVHGLERVGSHVVLNYLSSLIHQLSWDQSLQHTFKSVRLVSIPMVNPGGLWLSTRSNPNGVDIMRNAPVDCDEPPYQFVSGQNISPKLPWFRGNPFKMEQETQALIRFVQNEMLASPFSMALDIHSGFGLKDRLWYPFSHTRKTFPHQRLVDRFQQILQRALPYHIYKVEKQTDSYLIHGDPWDYVQLQSLKDTQNTFIPWCLEMGSWTWLKKNPTQIFSKPGLFNPVLPHRYGRIMRRHRGLLDIFLRATLNYENWSDKQWETGSLYGDLDAKVPTG